MLVSVPTVQTIGDYPLPTEEFYSILVQEEKQEVASKVSPIQVFTFRQKKTLRQHQELRQ
jgi:hypothetical protein